MKYTLIKKGSDTVCIKDNEEECCIPVDSKNSDYIKYLLWAESNTADEEQLS